eukprot:scaffold115677_cov59-Attheya_sp.AAC.1
MIVESTTAKETDRPGDDHGETNVLQAGETESPPETSKVGTGASSATSRALLFAAGVRKGT